MVLFRVDLHLFLQGCEIDFRCFLGLATTQLALLCGYIVGRGEVRLVLRVGLGYIYFYQ